LPHSVHESFFSRIVILFFISAPRPPISTLFPYTTLFRSQHAEHPRGHAPHHEAEDQRERDRLAQHRGEHAAPEPRCWARRSRSRDRKSTRLNSSHVSISYAVFCLKKKKHQAMPVAH